MPIFPLPFRASLEASAAKEPPAGFDPRMPARYFHGFRCFYEMFSEYPPPGLTPTPGGLLNWIQFFSVK